MPRTKGSAAIPSAIRQVQHQLRSVLAKLRQDIRVQEIELAQLKRDEASLGRLAGHSATRGGAAHGPRPAGGGRTNWRKVLEQMPKQFKASNVRKVRGLEEKRPSEIFAAITRWMDAELVKRKTRGLYQKV